MCQKEQKVSERSYSSTESGQACSKPCGMLIMAAGGVTVTLAALLSDRRIAPVIPRSEFEYNDRKAECEA